jgi:hypothetical protein
MRLLCRNLFEEAAGAHLVRFEPTVFSHRPGHQRLVEVPESRI